VRCMVVESQVVIYDCIIGMVRLEQMLEGPRSLLGGGFDIMDLYRG
jgi:hypothetical protein